MFPKANPGSGNEQLVAVLMLAKSLAHAGALDCSAHRYTPVFCKLAFGICSSTHKNHPLPNISMVAKLVRALC